MPVLVVNNIAIYSEIPSIHEHLSTIISASKFHNFIYSIDKKILCVKSVKIIAVKWFCNPAMPTPDKLGFVYMEVNATDNRTGKEVPGVVFLRGCAVAVYIRIEVEGKKYVVLTKQVRVPMGGLVEEIPAGMMDDNSCFAGVAIKEISEETGLKPPSFNSLIQLGDPIKPSAGGCDEQIQLFFWETKVSSENLEKMKTKIFGAPDENESIQLIFVPIEDYEARLLTMGDVKATCAHLYAKNMGLLEEFNKVKTCKFWR
jgi:ADP-sugar diphosphatase